MMSEQFSAENIIDALLIGYEAQLAAVASALQIGDEISLDIAGRSSGALNLISGLITVKKVYDDTNGSTSFTVATAAGLVITEVAVGGSVQAAITAAVRQGLLHFFAGSSLATIGFAAGAAGILAAAVVTGVVGAGISFAAIALDDILNAAQDLEELESINFGVQSIGEGLVIGEILEASLYLDSTVGFEVNIRADGAQSLQDLQNLADDFYSNYNTKSRLVTIRVTDAVTGSTYVKNVADYEDYSDVVLEGTEYADYIVGGTNGTIIEAGDGDDLIEGGIGGNTINAGLGDDTIHLNPADTEPNYLDGGDGSDTLVLNTPHSVTFNKLTNIETIYAQLPAVLNLSSAGNEVFDFSNTSFNGHFIKFKAINTSPLVALSITGSAFSDVIEGDIGAEILNGNGGFDILLGGGGNDRLNGGAGNDYLVGGDGDDVIISTGFEQESQSIQSEYISAGAGHDEVYLEGSAGFFTQNPVVLLGSGNDALNLQDGSSVRYVDGGDGVDKIQGQAGDDQLDGGAGNDTLWGGYGADTLVGGIGYDTLIGSVGSDICLPRTFVAHKNLFECER